MKKEESEHKKEYRDQRLQDVFPPALGYYFAKIYEAIQGSKPVEFGSMHVKLIAETISDFKGRLKKRGELDTYDSVVYLLDLIEYPMQELASYFTRTTTRPINAKTANIFAFFIKKHLEELKSLAIQIDKS